MLTTLTCFHRQSRTTILLPRDRQSTLAESPNVGYGFRRWAHLRTDRARHQLLEPYAVDSEEVCPGTKEGV